MKSRRYLLLIFIPIAVGLIALCLGRYSISPRAVIDALLPPYGLEEQSGIELVVLNVRLPRILLSLIIGAGLSVAGCCLQSVFSNPLASPDTMGVSSGAAFGAALGILVFNNAALIQGASLLFGLVSISVTWLLSKVRGKPNILMIVLAGVITSAFFTALLSCIKYIADPQSKLPEITYWLMGSLSGSSYDDLKLGAPLIIIPVILILLLRWRFNILVLSEEEITSLGMNARVMRWTIILLSTLIIAASVSLCGQIGWVGLVIPHIARPVRDRPQKNNPRRHKHRGDYCWLLIRCAAAPPAPKYRFQYLPLLSARLFSPGYFSERGESVLKLEVFNGCFSYARRPILKGLNFKLDSHEVLAIIGPNGVGKTTLLKCIMNLLPWDSGFAALDGQKIDTFPVKQLWRQIAYVPQAKQAGNSTVREMIVLGRSAHIGLFSQPGEEDYAIAENVMQRLYISALADRPCNKLSGGELQMVLIARALAIQPKIMIIDEPESNLDYHNQLHVLELISEISQSISCVLNTHYPDHALRFADKSLLLLNGGGNIYGPTTEVITESNLKQAFRIDVHIGYTEINGENHPFIIPLHSQNRL
jgi:ABC-type cobalamin/Fe3+-siderophores transport system ATPase subunit/ABC-type Fe3+-siderophore transport system permease subunit